MRGLYLCFEGGDGAGKDTFLDSIPSRLFGRNIIRTRQPGGTEFADLIRSAILSDYAKNSDGLTQLLLHYAARHEAIEAVVRPALVQGHIVLSNRSHASSYAYQLFAQEGGKDPRIVELFALLNTLVFKKCEPDAYFYFDVDPVEGKRRRNAASAQQTLTHFDLRDIEFHEKVRQGYMDFGRRFGNGKFHIIDAMPPKEEVQRGALRELDSVVRYALSI